MMYSTVQPLRMEVLSHTCPEQHTAVFSCAALLAISGSFWAIQACAVYAAGVWQPGKQYLLLYALSLIDEAAIPDPCQVLHDELCCLRLACA